MTAGVAMMLAGQTPEGAGAAKQGFDAGETIIGHVSNSSLAHPLIHLPTVLGIDMSVTKHVFMLWCVAATLFVVLTWIVRRSAARAELVPTGAMNGLETIVEFLRDGVIRPNVGEHWTDTWTPLILTFFFFILGANMVGLLPIFDTIALLDRWVLHTGPDSFLKHLVHGGPTATGNYNVTAGLAMVTFIAIIVAGTRTHGFVTHWKNLVPHGLPWPLYILLIPMELVGMLVRPFALTMRLAANMTGGHIAILAIMSFIFIFSQTLGAAGGVGIGLTFSVPLSVALSALEIIVVLVQAYVFTLLSAVFIGMAINVHH